MTRKKSPAQLEREIAEILTHGGDKRRVAHVGFGTFAQSKLPAKKPSPDPHRASLGPGPRSESERQIHPEMFAVMDRHGKIIGTSRSARGAMALAPNDKSYALVRGEYTSEGTKHGVGRGRQVAVREFDPSGGFRWYM